MATHRSDKRNCLVFGLAAALAFPVAANVIYYLQPPSDGTLWGSPEIDMIAYGESAVSAGDNDLSVTSATTSNGAVEGSAASETATLVEQNETAVSAGIATTHEPGFGSPQSSSQNTKETTASAQTAVAQNTESDNLIATADTSPGFSEPFFLSALSGAGGQTTGRSGPPLSGSNSGAPFPNPVFPPSAFMDPPSGAPAGGRPIAITSPSNSPRTTAPQSTSGPSNISSPTPSGTPIVSPPGGSPSLGGPPLETGGAPPTAGGPTSITIIPGGSPRNPITPTASTPDGTSILPISGAGCGTSNCGGHSWEFFDPPVAIGYDYALQPTVAGQPLTFGVTDIMVTTKVGSGIYDLWPYDALTGQYVNSSLFSPNHQTITISADPNADPSGAFNVVAFLLTLTPTEDQELGITDPYLGLTQFSIRGISPSAGLNPDDPAAFITGLLFAGSINGDLLITPLAIDSLINQPVDPPIFDVAVPEPATIALFLAALVFWRVLLQRRSTA